MAKTRKASRKSVKSRVLAPAKHTVAAVGNSLKTGVVYAKNILKRTIKGVGSISGIWYRHAKGAVRNVKGTTRRRRGRK